MPSKRKSSACVDYVPALCTHRPSLLPIEWLSEAFGPAQGGRQRPPRVGKFVKLGHLEEVKVVTRYPVLPPMGASLETSAWGLGPSVRDSKEWTNAGLPSGGRHRLIAGILPPVEVTRSRRDRPLAVHRLSGGGRRRFASPRFRYSRVAWIVPG